VFRIQKPRFSAGLFLARVTARDREALKYSAPCAGHAGMDRHRTPQAIERDARELRARMLPHTVAVLCRGSGSLPRHARPPHSSPQQITTEYRKP
jgi:hypothetical protein